MPGIKMACHHLSVKCVGGRRSPGQTGRISPTSHPKKSGCVHQDLQQRPHPNQQHHHSQPATHRQQSILDRRSCLVHTGLFLLCVAVYWNALGCQFVFDDVTAIRDNKDLRPHVPLRNLLRNDFWGTPITKEQSHKSYRPLTVLTFRWNYAVGGLNPVGYHLVNILLHGVVTVLYYRVCRHLVSSSVAFVASVFFALHPIHTEAVTGVVGRAELLASLFYLSALISYSKSAHRHHQSHQKQTRWKWLALTVVFTTLALLSKEQGITIVAVCIVYELIVVQKLLPADIFSLRFVSSPSLPLWLRCCCQRLFVTILSAVVIITVRLRVMGQKLPVFTRFDNPAAISPAPTKHLTFNYLTSLNSWLLLSPCDLICDWTMSTVPLVESILDVRNLGTLATYGALALLVRSAVASTSRSHASAISMGLAMTVFPYLPASNLFFPVGFVIAERVLYLPSMGFCLLVAYGLQRLYKRSVRLNSSLFKVSLSTGVIFLALVFMAKTVTRNWDWKDELTIFSSGLKVTRDNAKLFNNVGHALESKKSYSEALRYFKTAVSIQPDDIGAHINLGRTYNQMKLYKEAEEAYLRAKSLLPATRPGETYQARVAPNHLNVFVNLATLISRNGTRLEEADSLYRQAISMRADYTQAYINRGDILLKLNRTKEAQEVYETALTYEQDNPDLLYNLAVVLLNQGEHGRAMTYLDKALEYDPDHYQALLNSAILIQETGSVELRHLAFERLMKIVQQGKTNERVYFNLGMLSMDNKDIQAAEMWFRKAIELKPDFRSALFNLALLLSETTRALEGAPFLKTLLWYYPDHVKGLILLGDLYVNHLRDLPSAERCYRHILKVEPNNIQAQHNLCVVMVEAGDLSLARDCLSEALSRAPHEEYIAKHLAIVEERLQLQATD